MCPFPHVFGEVTEFLIIELHEMLRVTHAVAFPVGFNWLCDRVQQEGVLKHMENGHFLVFLVVWVLFTKILGRLRSNLC